MEALVREIFAREEDIRKRELKLGKARGELASLRARLEQLISDPEAVIPNQGSGQQTAIVATGPGLARATATIAARIISILDGEPNAMSADDVAGHFDEEVNLDVIRTTLSKLHQRGVIARPEPGRYSSMAYAEEILEGKRGVR